MQHGKQHGHGGHGEQHGRGGGRSGGERHEGHDRDRNRNLGRERHRHIGRRDWREHEGHREVFFGGIWFGCEVWPEWVFEEEVYFEEVDGEYFVYSYVHPRWSVQVVVVE